MTTNPNKGKIRVGKYDYKTGKQPSTPGYHSVLIHTTGDLSPYTMKDANGTIMENAWQFAKVFPSVMKQRQSVSQFQPNDIRWSHPAEKHMNADGTLTKEYWAWREKGMKHSRWVRYPAGYSHHHEAKGSVVGIGGEEAVPNKYEIVGYIEARQRVYIPKYKEIAILTPQFAELKKMLDAGVNLQINEVDGPRYADVYPYNQTKDGSIEITPEILDALIKNPLQACGHGYVLAGCLLGLL